MTMVKLTANHIKRILRGILFIVLLISFYLLYMKKALDQFTKESKTIVQSKIESEPEPPVLIVCPVPPFKNSFFKNHGLCKKKYPGISAYFWAAYKQGDDQFFQNNSSMLELYMDMSYELGTDWDILVNRKVQCVYIF